MKRRTEEWLLALADVAEESANLCKCYSTADRLPTVPEEKLQEQHMAFDHALECFKKASKRGWEGK